MCVDGELCQIYKYVYNWDKLVKIAKKEYKQKKHHKKGGSSQGRYQRDTQELLKVIINEVSSLINSSIEKNEKYIIIQQGNLEGIQSRINAQLVQSVQSPHPNDFAFNKNNIWEIIQN